MDRKLDSKPTIIKLIGPGLILIGLVLVVIFWPRRTLSPFDAATVAATDVLQSSIIPTQTLPTPSDAPIVPTITPSPTHTPSPTETAAPTASATPLPTAAFTATTTRVLPTPTRTPAPAPPASNVPLWQGRVRFGAGLASGSISQYPVEQLGLGWYLNWSVSAGPLSPAGIEYAQMIRVRHGVLTPDAVTIANVARAVQGALWLVGNEPDRAVWQDDATPAQYAQAYHAAYTAIKQADPTALVAIAGVVQPTPLRLRYLDAALAAYQEMYGAPMPVDVWNVHNFIVREEQGSWGAEIPPGLTDSVGVLHDVQDSDSLDIFKAQVVAFRQWMRERGQQNKPLIVSEYGILMPPDFGFDPERVSRFMLGTFDFFLSARDAAIGYPQDDYRLVQRWCWYSLGDTEFAAGNLFDPHTFQWTPVGRAWQAYVARQ
jgi:hypothetical protein